MKDSQVNLQLYPLPLPYFNKELSHILKMSMITALIFAAVLAACQAVHVSVHLDGAITASPYQYGIMFEVNAIYIESLALHNTDMLDRISTTAEMVVSMPSSYATELSKLLRVILSTSRAGQHLVVQAYR
jgi:hypothetical protein